MSVKLFDISKSKIVKVKISFRSNVVKIVSVFGMALLLGILNAKFTCKCGPTMRRSISLFSRKKKTNYPYVIVRPTHDEYCDILHLMWHAYHPHEPTTKSLGLGYVHNPVFDDSALKILSQGYSLVAKCKHTGCIVGASLNYSTCEWDADALDKMACTLKCSDTQQLYHFWAHLQRMPNLYEDYCVDKIFEISNVFVSPHDRGKGLAFKLMESSRNLGSDAGFRLIRVDATSVYTAKICEKLGMQLVKVLPYCSYLGENNQPVFRPEPPNTEVKIYIDLPHAMKVQKGLFG